jgi:hypothetical protein
MKKIPATALAAAAMLALALPATAQTWDEVGDAGDLPGTAQVTVGAGPLTSITGTVSSGTDGDLYQIFITGGGTFSATTVGTPGTLLDTQLFLFNGAGIGVYANDDTVGSARSTLPSGNPLTPTTPGLYFLAITGFDRDPVSSAGFIFPNTPFQGVFGPTGPGGRQPLSGYDGPGQFTGTYTIALTGAEFAVIPEPGTLTLLGASALGLLAYSRRRRAQLCSFTIHEEDVR